jgi:16S rRNA (adenine1518-N6/adenine1519-N6)-dimethyltransferase
MAGVDENLARRTRRLLAELGRHPKRSRGQSFLIDPSIAERIAALVCGGDRPRVLEIGAGLGGLTEALARRCDRLAAVEIDEAFAPALRSLFADQRQVRVIVADALTADLSALCDGEVSTWRLAGNLPYNAATAILLHALDRWPGFERIVITVQREVGDRLLASPGHGAYGSLSVLARYHVEEARVIARVPRGVFYPQPKVDSVVLLLQPRRVRPAEESLEPLLFALIRAGFGQRRKKLSNALAAGGLSGLRRGAMTGLLGRAGLAERVRAEELALDDFIRLARVLAESGVTGRAPG